MQTTFDVPGHITLNDVKRPVSGETAEQRVIRLAMKAVIQGVELLGNPLSGQCLATSASRDGLFYFVSTELGICQCEGFQRHGVCQHLALAMVTNTQAVAPDAA